MNTQNSQSFISQDVLNQIGKQLGFSNGITSQYVELANTLLMSGMRKNVRSQDGLSNLFNLVKNQGNQGGGGSLLDTIFGVLGKSNNQGTATQSQGQGTLDGIFGRQLDPIITQFAKATGLPKDKAKQLLMILAPIALAYFAKKMTERNMNEKDFAREVELEYDEPDTEFKTSRDGGLLEKLLDRDKDGNVMDEVGSLLKLLLR